MSQSPKDTNLKDVVKAISVAAEAQYHAFRIRRNAAALTRHKTRQVVLAKWLWEQLFEQLQRELARPKRDIKLIVGIVGAMRRLVPPPAGRNDKRVGFPATDSLAASFADAFARARQRTAEEAAEQAKAEEEDVMEFERLRESVPPASVAEEEDVDSAGDPTDVGTKRPSFD